MDIKQKLALEKPTENIIRLYREGIFYVAYNHSALRFKHFFHPQVKILKHVLKSGEWYLRMGVVQTSGVLTSLNVKNADGSWCDYLELPCSVVETSLEEVVPDKVVAKSSTGKGKKAGEDTSDAEQRVIKAIRNVNIGDLTPLQALTLVSEWQKTLLTE